MLTYTIARYSCVLHDFTEYLRESPFFNTGSSPIRGYLRLSRFQTYSAIDTNWCQLFFAARMLLIRHAATLRFILRRLNASLGSKS